ncbi:MAG: hypothetical protein ACI311_06695 [Bacilli bacterium]
MKKDKLIKTIENSSNINFNFKDISSKIDYDNFQKNKKFNKKNLIWMIPTLVTSLSLIIVLPITLKDKPFKSNLNYLTSPNRSATRDTITTSISQITYDSYNTFTNRFVDICFQSSLEKNGEISLGISIPDAYISFAITAICSNDIVQEEFLSYMGLNSIEELKVTTKEIVNSLCTLYEDENDNLSGGYNLNSIWLDPNQTVLKEKDTQLYKDLEEIFDVSIFSEALTSDKANAYLKEKGLKNKPTPLIEVDDENPSASSNMSVYYCLDGFGEEQKIYKEQYLSKNHKMEYSYNGKSEKIDYIEKNKIGNLYEGTNFISGTTAIKNLDISYFLPDQNVQPSSILSDVLAKNYTKKTYYIEELEEETSYYKLKFKQPYFKLNNRVELDYDTLLNILPNSCTIGGINEKLVYGTIDNSNAVIELYLKSIIQQSIMTFDYNGFYSCSVTIIESAPGSAMDFFQEYTLEMNRPYIFSINNSNIKLNSSYCSLPLVIGEIVNPNYYE